ncbi:MAG: formylglycine-generating enzyme family protein, partial [Opitutaceae bacterium]|nr:formylglycine-generating enzyme family protein [Opitutaceae bacterium]
MSHRLPPSPPRWCVGNSLRHRMGFAPPRPTIILIALLALGRTSAPAAEPGGTTPPRAVSPFDANQAQVHQQAWARYVGGPVQETNSIGLALVLIPAGEFDMGSTPEQVAFALEWLKTVPRPAPGEDRRIREQEAPQHRVVLTRPYRIGRTEITVGHYRQFVAATHYVTEVERFGGGNSGKTDESDPRKKNVLWHSPGYPTTDQSPVTQLTWNDMIAFCNWLNAKEGRAACYQRDDHGGWRRVPEARGYRMPTEAEWEFACRAGTTTHFSFGDDVRALDDHAWFNRTAETKTERGTRPVATKRPNPFGLFDLHGNAWERCEDFFNPDGYGAGPREDPVGPATGTNRMVRGGGWHYFDLHARSA